MTVSDDLPRVPMHLWIIGILTLLWNAMGVWDYLATQFKIQSYMAQFPPEQLDYYYSFPSWAVAGWAFGVWGAFVGSILLLFRKRWALWAFAASVAGLVVSTIYNFGMSNGAEIAGTAGVIFSVVIWIVALFLLGYSWMQCKNGVLT